MILTYTPLQTTRRQHNEKRMITYWGLRAMQRLLYSLERKKGRKEEKKRVRQNAKEDDDDEGRLSLFFSFPVS